MGSGEPSRVPRRLVTSTPLALWRMRVSRPRQVASVHSVAGVQ